MKTTKYNRTLHLPFSLGTTSDDRISKEYDFLENVDIIITEKLDGQNDCLTRDSVFARSHATPTNHLWDRAIWDIHKRVKGSIGIDEYVFGENMYAKHSIEYKGLESYYYIFGVRVKDEWLSWDDVLEYAYCLNIPTVPVLFDGKTNDLKKTVLNLIDLPSNLDGYDIHTGKEMMEGCVVRNKSSFLDDNFSKNILKWVRANHVNTTVHWTRNWTRNKIKHEN